MKPKLKQLLQMVPWLTDKPEGSRAEDTLWRDWHIILWASALALLGLFCVGAYTFLVTTERVTDPVVENTYHPQTNKEVMVETVTTLRERTKKFEALRDDGPQAPDTGTLRGTEDTEEDVETTSEVEVVSPVVPD